MAAAAALQDLTAREKEQVGLEERRKHAKTRTKKSEKSLADVSTVLNFVRSVTHRASGHQSERRGFACHN